MNIETPVSDGHRYGCWGTQRGGRKAVVARNGWKKVCLGVLTWWSPVSTPVITLWLPIACGHDNKHRDPSCSGCPNIGNGNA